MINVNQLGPAEVLSIVRFNSNQLDVKELIILTVGDLLDRGIIICKPFESHYKGTTGQNYFIKQSGSPYKSMRVYESAIISSLNSDSWVSLKQYGYTLAKFCTDPLMYSKPYDFQAFVNKSLIDKGLVKKSRAWLFFTVLTLTPLGKSIEDGIGKHELKRCWPVNLDDVRKKLENFVDEKILFSNSALSQFNRAQYPVIITKD